MAKKFDYVARFNGGANAGHTVEAEGKKLDFHMLPSGLLYPHIKNIIGNGVVIHLETLFNEIKKVEDMGIEVSERLWISNRAHVSTNLHLMADEIFESRAEKPIGSTKKGIGYTYGSKMLRQGIRVSNLKHLEDDFLKNKYLQIY